MIPRRSDAHSPVGTTRLSIAFFVILGFCTVSFAEISSPFRGDDVPQFEDYQVPLYKGKIRSPKWIHKVDTDEWRDGLDKLVEPPEINFAGTYFIAVHSCGTGCRYYTLTDLSSGRDLDVLDMFTTGDPPPRTRHGHQYLTELFSRPNSRMLVAQYGVELGREELECRERVFLFEDGKLKPITGTRRQCRKIQPPPQP